MATNYPMTNEQVLTSAINLGEQLLVNGAESSRVEDAIGRICAAYKMPQTHTFCIASCIIVSMETATGEWLTQTRRILNYGTNMHKLDRLNDLSRTICHTPLSFEEIQEKYNAIVNEKVYSFSVQLLIAAMIAASFTIFFGGNLQDAFAALFIGAFLKLTLYGLQTLKMKPIFYNIICSIASGLACIFSVSAGLGYNLDAIMIGNIMLLIPGVLLTNSFRDFISGDMITGILHFSEAIITAICVAGGFIIAIILTGGRL